MGFIQNFKIKQILTTVMLLVLGMLIFVGLVSRVAISKIENDSSVQMNEIMPNTFDFLSLQLSIANIQMWFLDTSATRAAEGFDDGLVEAEKSFKNSNVYIDRLIYMHAELGEAEMVSELKDFKSTMKNYYDAALKMANAYIKDGESAR